MVDPELQPHIDQLYIDMAADYEFLAKQKTQSVKLIAFIIIDRIRSHYIPQQAYQGKPEWEWSKVFHGRVASQPHPHNGQVRPQQSVSSKQSGNVG